MSESTDLPDPTRDPWRFTQAYQTGIRPRGAVGLRQDILGVNSHIPPILKSQAPTDFVRAPFSTHSHPGT